MEADTKEVSDLIPQHNEVPLSTNFLDNNVKGSQNVLPDDKLIKKSETTKDDSSLNNASDSESQANKENIDDPEEIGKVEGNASNERPNSKSDTIENISKNIVSVKGVDFASDKSVKSTPPASIKCGVRRHAPQAPLAATGLSRAASTIWRRRASTVVPRVRLLAPAAPRPVEV
mgnify:CR=1 FL=1